MNDIKKQINPIIEIIKEIVRIIKNLGKWWLTGIIGIIVVLTIGVVLISIAFLIVLAISIGLNIFLDISEPIRNSLNMDKQLFIKLILCIITIPIIVGYSLLETK